MKKKWRVPAITVVTAAVAVGLGLVTGYQAGKRAAAEEEAGRDKDAVVINEVKTAVSLLGVMERKYEEGEIGLPQARLIAKELVEGLRYGKNGEGRFWIEEAAGAKTFGGFSLEFKPFGWRVGTKGYGGD